MKKKIGTIMEERLLYEAKKLALESNKQLNQIFEEALAEYLEKRQKEKGKTGSIARTWAMFKIPPEKLKEIMNEPGIFES